MGRVRLIFCFIGSQPACQLQLASQLAMWPNVNLSGFGLVRYLVAGRVRLIFCLIGSQPACQLQLANQPAMLPNTGLPGFGLVRYLVAGRVRLIFCLIGSQPVCQGQLVSQPAVWPNIKLSGFGVGKIFGGRRTRSPTTLGPSSQSHHSHWFPLESNLPDQGQASNTNELCCFLYTFGTTFRDRLQFCINTA